jgi:S1-C subfamily serine protease
MRENESDSGDGWAGPYDYISPWAARDPGEADQTSAVGDQQETVAFGGLADEAGGPGQGSYVRRGNLDPWYGSDRDESRYGGGGWDPGPPPRRARRRGRLLVYLTVAALAAGVGAGLTVAFDRPGTSPSAGVSASEIPSPHNDAAGSGSGLNEAAVERKVVPGLVDITAQLKYAAETAEGTGMILSPSGLVLTNNHVIDGATYVKVSLAGNPRQSYTARVLGYDSTDDVALLQLTGASGLATVNFGNSSQVRVGTPVLALGDAEGRGRVTPARGDISGLDRSIQASDEGSGRTEDLSHMLQTNAQIQQGDSGGALANSAGQVIGMITAASTGSGGQPGGTMGFAIPINSALAIAERIADSRASSTVYIGLPGFLGVLVAQSSSRSPRQQAADEQQSGDGPGGPGRSRGCLTPGENPGVPGTIAPARSGALILGVLCGTAALSKGLAPGDVIISVNGQAITTPDALTAITARYHAGAVVSVGWEDTNGSRHAARIKLGDGPPR